MCVCVCVCVCVCASTFTISVTASISPEAVIRFSECAYTSEDDGSVYVTVVGDSISEDVHVFINTTYTGRHIIYTCTVYTRMYVFIIL